MELLQVKVQDHGPFALHNYPCPVCRAKKAVLNLNYGVMQPCWTCQGKGWEVHKKTKFQKWKEKWSQRLFSTSSLPHMESVDE